MRGLQQIERNHPRSENRIGMPLTSEGYARHFAAQAPPLPSRSPPPERVVAILREVARDHGVKISDIIGERRRYPEAHARHDAMWRLKKMDWAGGWRGHPSTAQIGAWLGGRDHSTVTHGVQAHERRRHARNDAAAIYQGSAR